ncbi:metallophosphoesterase [Aerococcaceae bacterium WGS1372]
MITINIKRLAKATVLLTAATMVGHKAFDTNIKLKKYEVLSQKVFSPIRIVFISDLHNNLFGKNQLCLKELIAEQKPDLVLLGGDIYDYVGNPNNATILLKWLANTFPTYYVTGNHEMRMDEVKYLKTNIRSIGVHVLEGDSLTFELGSSRINIHGVDDARNKSVFNRQLNELGTRIDSSEFNLLLSHRPEQVKQYENYFFDLILSGHAHGGQWRLPGLINGLYTPQQGMFPQYAGGEYQLTNGAKLIVGRGLIVQHQQFPRIFNPPELLVIDINNAD